MKTAAKFQATDDHLKKMLDVLDELHINDSAVDDELGVEEKPSDKTSNASALHGDHVERIRHKRRNKAIGNDHVQVAPQERKTAAQAELVSSSGKPLVPAWRQNLREVLEKDMPSAETLIAFAKQPKARQIGFLLAEFVQTWSPRQTRAVIDRNLFLFSEDDASKYGRFINMFHNRSPPQEVPGEFSENLARAQTLKCVLACTSRLPMPGHSKVLDLAFDDSRGWHCFSIERWSIAKRWLVDSPADADCDGNILMQYLESLRKDFAALGYDLQFSVKDDRFSVHLRAPQYVREVLGKNALTDEDRAWFRQQDIQIDDKE